MDEKWRLALWAAAAAKDMEFAATQRSAYPFVEEDFVFFDKLRGRRSLSCAFLCFFDWYGPFLHYIPQSLVILQNDPPAMLLAGQSSRREMQLHKV